MSARIRAAKILDDLLLDPPPGLLHQPETGLDGLHPLVLEDVAGSGKIGNISVSFIFLLIGEVHDVILQPTLLHFLVLVVQQLLLDPLAQVQLVSQQVGLAGGVEQLQGESQGVGE